MQRIVRLLPGVVIAGLLLYVLWPQMHDVAQGLKHLQHADLLYVGISIAATLVTFFCGALTYTLLAFRPLNLRDTILVQFAAMFVNRLIPAGVGALGTNFAYLIRHKHSKTEAGSLVALNNLLGFTGNMLLLVIAVLAFGIHWAIRIPQLSVTVLFAAGVVSVAVVVVAVRFWRHRIARSLRRLARDLVLYRRKPQRLIGAQTSSLLLTLANTTSLYFAALAVGVTVSPVAALAILTAGVGVGSATPTPGGLGGFEAGLVAGFVAVGIDPIPALAAAVLYRLVSYWFTLLLGGIAFVYARRQKLF